MRFFIQQVHKEQIEIDIPQTTTLDQLRELLISQYSYPDQQMVFINNGNILKEANALMKLNANSRILVYIKNKDSKKSRKRSKKIKKEENKKAQGEHQSEKEEKKEEPENKAPEEKIEQDQNLVEQRQDLDKSPELEQKPSDNNSNDNNNANSAENQYQEPLVLSSVPSIPVDSEPLYYENGFPDADDFSDIPKEQLDFYLSECFKKIHLKQLYDEKCNFYANLSETMRISGMIDHNPGLLLIVSQFTKENFSIASMRNTIDLDFAMELAGFVSSSPISLADEYEAMYDEMPNVHTEAVQRLIKKYKKTRRETVKAFVDSNYNEEDAEKLLNG